MARCLGKGIYLEVEYAGWFLGILRLREDIDYTRHYNYEEKAMELFTCNSRAKCMTKLENDDERVIPGRWPSVTI